MSHDDREPAVTAHQAHLDQVKAKGDDLARQVTQELAHLTFGQQLDLWESFDAEDRAAVMQAFEWAAAAEEARLANRALLDTDVSQHQDADEDGAGW